VDSLNEGSAHRMACTYIGQHNAEGKRTDLHAPSDMQTRDTSARDVEDSTRPWLARPVRAAKDVRRIHNIQQAYISLILVWNS